MLPNCYTHNRVIHCTHNRVIHLVRDSIFIYYICYVIRVKYCNFTGLQECNLSINRTLCDHTLAYSQ